MSLLQPPKGAILKLQQGRSFKAGGLLRMYQSGEPIHTPKERRGVRQNPDGSHSSHLMAREYLEGTGWVVFPTLFQDSKPYADDSKNWVDMGESMEKDGWWKTYKEAESRGEVYVFGDDEAGAIDFADKGSWKKK
tara:strand:- start:2151 stop:2555 length:405 start_codon:yes stop_codon:yes gene_type:complete